MSFDDGTPYGFDAERMKARLRDTLISERISFPQLCRDAGLSPDAALRAIDVGSDGFPETLPILQRLSVALGREADWLPFGFQSGRSCADDEATRVRRLAWEYIYKARVPKRDWDALVQSALAPIEQYSGGDASARFRRRLPRTLKDMARLYQQLLSRNQSLSKEDCDVASQLCLR